MTNNYKQYFASSGVYFGLLFQTYFKSSSKMNRYEGKLIKYACITRETFVFTFFWRVFHSILKLDLYRHACRHWDQIISTCRHGKIMPTTAVVNRSNSLMTCETSQAYWRTSRPPQSWEPIQINEEHHENCSTNMTYKTQCVNQSMQDHDQN